MKLTKIQRGSVWVSPCIKGRGCLKTFVICFHEGLVFLLFLIATKVLTEKLRDKCGVFQSTLPKSPPKAPVTGTEGNVSLNSLKWRRKLKFISSSTGVQTIILITAHLEEVP